MADVKISALPAATTPLTGGEVLPIVQSGTTTQVAVSNLTAGLAGTASININGTVGATTPTTGAFTSGTFSTTLGVTGTSTVAAVNASGSILASNGGNYLTTGAAPVYIGGRSTTGDGYIGVNMKVGVGNYVVNGFAGQIIFGPTGAWDFNTAASGTAGNAVSDTSKMSISNTGAVTIPGTLGVSTGAAVGGATPGAGGLAFPATAVAVANVNTLDDYEEGTWTPSLGGNTTYNAASGNYIKIGKMVYVEGNIWVNSIGTGSTSIVSGLPFTSATQTTNSRGTLSVNSFYSTANIVTFIALYLNSASTTAQFQGIAAAGTSVSTIGIFGANTDVYFAGCYYASN